MLYYLIDQFAPDLLVFQYITVRAVAGAGTAFLISVLLGPYAIRQLRRLKLGQIVRSTEAPSLHELHGKKEGTPTMGGVLIIFAIIVASLLWSRLDTILIWLTVGTLLAFGAVGFADDLLKVRRGNSKGLSARAKALLQLAWALFVAVVMLKHPETSETARHFMVPFIKEPVVAEMGAVWVVLFVSLIVVGSSNAVNLTDGLDGLAIGCTSSVAMAYLVMAYAAGHAAFADYLYIPHIRAAGELAVFCGCMAGAAFGFLWHNCHPASVFMGDTGSLALGGAIAMVAILIKQELALIIVGGVFVMEATSVILQVASFKLTGKRIFAMAPIHHHFEVKANPWSETQVTIRFWVLSIIFALLGLLTLKIR
ncbi:MAG: phospho-N-acetylmuramoyl-pentapeptide-transferase [Candidatus Promineifilaceae bacterium]|jgi:phospho-N-acetylmuramoyl-pentapeptide-transferase